MEELKQNSPEPRPNSSDGTNGPTPEEKTAAASAENDQPVYPVGFKLISVFLGLFLAVLCAALDRMILATAIPKITTEFNSLPDVGWYGSAYLLTSASFQLMFGKVYAEINLKWTFIIALVIFEVGSIICAVAPSSAVLIVGRAVAGVGAAGLATGALTIISIIAPLHHRPQITGAIGAAMGLSMIVAPTIGGAFADNLTWRWCFWINLPLGGVAIITVFFFLDGASSPKSQSDQQKVTLLQILEKFDAFGTVFLLPSLIGLLLALQWGGTAYSWNSWRVILLFCIFGVGIVIWFAIQVYEGDKATLPLRILRQRSMIAALWYMFCVMGMFTVLVYFIPIWFQTVLGVSAYQSGINNLASTIAQALMAVASGFITSAIGYYVPVMLAGSILSSIAAGLATRFGLDTSTGYWIGTLVILGLGSGSGSQQSLMVPQTVFTGKDTALGISVMVFSQTLAATVLLSVGANLFQDRLLTRLAADVPSVDAGAVVAAGAADLRQTLAKLYTPAEVQGILRAYSDALQPVWIMAVVLAALSVLGAAACEWMSVKKDVVKEGAAKEGHESEGRGAKDEVQVEKAARTGGEEV